MKQLTSYQPTPAPVSNLRREMDRIFNELIPFSWRLDDNETGMMKWTPTTDMLETEAEYIVEVELPGLSKKDIQINCHDNLLSIEGEQNRNIKKSVLDIYGVSVLLELLNVQ